MGLGDLTRHAVLAAIREYDRVGQDEFLERYGFEKARAFYLRYEGSRYDSKAIAGAAHGYLPDRKPLQASEFSGGEATVARKLRELGFVVPPRRSPDWTRDEVILACDLVMQNNWRQLEDSDERVIELSGVLQLLPIHPHDLRSDTFRNPNGVARKTADIASQHPDYRGRPTNGGVTDRLVLQDFRDSPDHMHAVAATLRNAALSGQFKQLPVPQTDDGVQEEADDDYADAEVREGRLLRRWHYARERDRSLRRKKIADFLKRNDHVFCEICLFDFEKVYGERGAQFTECHHVTPLHVSGDTTTTLDDLVLLCANCHRMIHRGSSWLTPNELRSLIEANRA
ncbi:HNH endonuclease [Nocardia sp. CDC153]|uniref:HNH endonuclease n=1 Tax=Nocardia sp. CDC153 TaxID=3112167 RepID=UPI002DB6F1D2|nr:HNH endonuclease [Nocardia sp. CDC153]MEC3957521.1 HNH endonuclease [Nocardia sp. CDC153]